MKLRIALPALLMSILTVTAPAGEEKTAHRHSADKNPAFARFQQIAGTWEGKEVEGRVGTDVRAEYRVTSGGTAVVETIFPGTEHEMITVIHPDGDDLSLTHYCMMGNQPQMKAAASGEGNQVAFRFVRVSNLKSPNDMHMHDVTYTFVDSDTLQAEWTHYHDAKPAGKVVFELKRKK
jgi:hypothetical protein